MFVIKRNGRKESVRFDKITSRIKKLCYGLDPELVDPALVAQKVCLGVYKGVHTHELDTLAAETAAHMNTEHPGYGLLAARIEVSNLHKETKKVFSEVCTQLMANIEPRTLRHVPLLAKEVNAFVQENAEELDAHIVYDRDFNYDYFGYKTLERSYIFRVDGRIVERPQHMIMRVSCGIHVGKHKDVKDTLDAVKETYDLVSQGLFTHATPTLYNAGTPRPQMSSCFLLTIDGDSIEGIYDTLKQCALISKSAGGIGLSIHKIRATGAYIGGTNGTSNGLVPMLRVFNNTARYVDQGGGKRKGAFAIYLEPWHADIFHFLDLRKNHGVEEERARDLFYGLWISDLFMQRVEDDETWSLFCPSEAPGLADCHGKEFEAKYLAYEKQTFTREGKKEQLLARQVIKARKLWQAIIDSQIETGTPYVLYKDACNAKSNQQNLGTIRSSNLCTEVIEYTAPDEIAVCNLASIALPKFVEKSKVTSPRNMKKEKSSSSINHQKLFHVTQVATKNLNIIIDKNHYPVEEARKSNMRHRPIGIGVQGLADTFMKMRFPFESKEAFTLNEDIFETIYYAALDASCTLARHHGPYESYEGSPASKGQLQFDLWGVTPKSGRWDWALLKRRIAKWGLRNSLLVAPMPTASTSQILGNNECFEPFTSNIYVRRTLAGEFVCVNKHLLYDLIKRELWTPKLKNKLIADKGSVQNIKEVPDDLKALYKTVWEMKGKRLIDMAAARGAYIDQSQSFNVHMTDVTYGKLTSLHFYAWKSGLKTGMYYLRTKAATDAIQFTVDQIMLEQEEEEEEEEVKSASHGDEKRMMKSSSSSTFFDSLVVQSPEPQLQITIGDFGKKEGKDFTQKKKKKKSILFDLGSSSSSSPSSTANTTPVRKRASPPDLGECDMCGS